MKNKLLNFSKNLIISLILVVTIAMLFFTISSYGAESDVSLGRIMRETISAWYKVILRLSLSIYFTGYMIIIIKLFIDRTPNRKAIIKESLLRFFIMFAVIYFLSYIMIFIFNLNKEGIKAAISLGKNFSGIDMENDEYDLYETALSKAYEVSAVPGFIGLVMYALLVFYTYKFVIVYAKRYINIVVLILLAPIIFVISTLNRIISGVKDGKITKWFKEFIFNVVIQTFHALFYSMLIGLTLKLSDNNEDLIGALLTLIMFGFIFNIDKIIRKMFDFVGGSTKINSNRIVKAGLSLTGAALGEKPEGSGNIFNKNSTKSLKEKSIHFKNSKEAETSSGFFNGLKKSSEEAFDNVKQQIPETANDLFGNVNEKVSGLGNFRNYDKNEIIKNTKEVLSGERVKNNLTDEEIIEQQHIMDEHKGLDSIRYGIVNGIDAFSNFGSKAKAELKKAYLAATNPIKRKVDLAVENYKLNIKDLNSSIEIIKNIRKIYQKNRRNTSSSVVIDASGAMMLVSERISPKELSDRLKDVQGKNLDLSAFVLENMGAQAFLSSKQGAPMMGMMVLAESNYERIEKKRIKEAFTGISSEKRTLKNGFSNKKNKSYKFNSFSSKTSRKITNRVLNKSMMRNHYLVSINRAREALKSGDLSARGDVFKVKSKFSYNNKYVRKNSIKVAQEIKVAQTASIQGFKGLVRKTRKIENSNNVGSLISSIYGGTRKALNGMKSLNTREIYLRRMLKNVNSSGVSTGVSFTKNNEKIAATGVVVTPNSVQKVKEKSSSNFQTVQIHTPKRLLQFVLDEKSNKLSKQVVSIDENGNSVVETYSEKSKATEKSINVKKESNPIMDKYNDILKSVVGVARLNEEGRRENYENMESTSKFVKQADFSESVNFSSQVKSNKSNKEQKVVTPDGKIVSQKINSKGIIDVNSIVVTGKASSEITNQIPELMTNDELGLEKNVSVEQKEEKFKELIQSVNSEILLNQVIDESKQKQSEENSQAMEAVDEMIVRSMYETNINSFDELKNVNSAELDYSKLESKELNEIEVKKVKFVGKVIENMSSKYIIDDVDDNDTIQNAIDILNERVEEVTPDSLLEASARVEESLDEKEKGFSDLMNQLARASYTGEDLERIKGLNKAEKKWAKEHDEEPDDTIGERIVESEKEEEQRKEGKKSKSKNKNQSNPSENSKKDKKKDDEDQLIPISFIFTGGVKNQGEKVTLNNRYSIKEFYDKVDKLDKANYEKTEAYFIDTYGFKLIDLQLPRFSFSMNPVEAMDGWTIYVVTDDENISDSENSKDEKTIRELINTYEIDIFNTYVKFLDEHEEITSFKELKENKDDRLELIKMIRKILFAKGESNSDKKAELVVDYLKEESKFVNEMNARNKVKAVRKNVEKNKKSSNKETKADRKVRSELEEDIIDEANEKVNDVIYSTNDSTLIDLLEKMNSNKVKIEKNSNNENKYAYFTRDQFN